MFPKKILFSPGWRGALAYMLCHSWAGGTSNTQVGSWFLETMFPLLKLWDLEIGEDCEGRGCAWLDWWQRGEDWRRQQGQAFAHCLHQVTVENEFLPKKTWLLHTFWIDNWKGGGIAKAGSNSVWRRPSWFLAWSDLNTTDFPGIEWIEGEDLC